MVILESDMYVCVCVPLDHDLTQCPLPLSLPLLLHQVSGLKKLSQFGVMHKTGLQLELLKSPPPPSFANPYSSMSSNGGGKKNKEKKEASHDASGGDSGSDSGGGGVGGGDSGGGKWFVVRNQLGEEPLLQQPAEVDTQPWSCGLCMKKNEPTVESCVKCGTKRHRRKVKLADVVSQAVAANRREEEQEQDSLFYGGGGAEGEGGDATTPGGGDGGSRKKKGASQSAPRPNRSIDAGSGFDHDEDGEDGVQDKGGDRGSGVARRALSYGSGDAVDNSTPGADTLVDSNKTKKKSSSIFKRMLGSKK